MQINEQEKSPPVAENPLVSLIPNGVDYPTPKESPQSEIPKQKPPTPTMDSLPSTISSPEILTPVSTPELENLIGTWYYMRSTEGQGDGEISITGENVEIIRDFENTPPRLLIREDSTMLIIYSDGEHESILTQKDTNFYEVHYEIPESFKDTNFCNYLTYNTETGLLKYTWDYSDINHYFSKDFPRQ